MTLLMLLAQAATQVQSQAINLAGPYVISGSALVAAMTALVKVVFSAGRFQEFKETMQSAERDRKNADSDLVRQHEIQRLSDHIDRRFDEVSQQIAELRKLKMEQRGI